MRCNVEDSLTRSCGRTVARDEFGGEYIIFRAYAEQSSRRISRTRSRERHARTHSPWQNLVITRACGRASHDGKLISATRPGPQIPSPCTALNPGSVRSDSKPRRVGSGGEMGRFTYVYMDKKQAGLQEDTHGSYNLVAFLRLDLNKSWKNCEVSGSRYQPD